MTRQDGMFQFKEGVTDGEITNCFETMKAMVGKIPELLDMEYGPYGSSVGLNDGYTQGFIMTFESLEAKEDFLPDPIHEDVKELVIPKLERVLVFDFNV